MTLNNWSASLAGLAPALGNHLWQSTMSSLQRHC